jgi:hypothetical protein
MPAMGARDGPSKEGEMPKELVFEPPGVAFADDPERRGAVDVRWDRESGYFQIGTHCPSFEVWVDGDKLPENAIPAEYGWWVSLDRRGINDLISTLRRARDAAFGKDE